MGADGRHMIGTKRVQRWYLLLDDGREFYFYLSPGAWENPLDEVNGFDKGEYWSVDISEEDHEFERDSEDDSFTLIPKERVVRVYSK